MSRRTHPDGTERRFATAEMHVGPGDCGVKLDLEAERYPGESTLLDTRVDLSGSMWITWSQRDEFADELRELLERYAI